MHWNWELEGVILAGLVLVILYPHPSLGNPVGHEAHPSPHFQCHARPFFLNERSERFVVNGSAIPEVNFDVGESYAGLLPIGSSGNGSSSELYFWFFPSTNAVAQQGREILIWLSGGPGCSSLGDLLQQNGPFLWQPGTIEPVANIWSWHRLTNVDVAQQFLGFWRNFVDTFALQGYKIYVTGYSYAGIMAPYIASAMLDWNDTRYFDLAGMMVYSGLYSKLGLAREIPVPFFINRWKNALSFNDTFTAYVNNRTVECGYTPYLEQYLVFPPRGPQPANLPGHDNVTNLPLPDCALWSAVFFASLELNPCFSVFDVTEQCPFRFDSLGFYNGLESHPRLPLTPYFNRPDVKAAINAPLNTNWTFCVDRSTVFAGGFDETLLSAPGSQPVLPRVIEHTANVILGHGYRDVITLPEGTLLTIQNLTWNGEMGFREEPTAPLFVPYHGGGNGSAETAAGAGVLETSHEERGLTWFGAAQAGHMLVGDQLALGFRTVEVLLGRVAGLTATVPFTVDVGEEVEHTGGLGNGTVVVSNWEEVAGLYRFVEDGLE
ncbi:Carboxypeptidase [Madurella fahalii]|uniref:Carboxypeptidase n=1 Tax=Madurella fahalii TaxID=1157608 RepID=A0ABQ0GLH3_9PEZI